MMVHRVPLTAAVAFALASCGGDSPEKPEGAATHEPGTRAPPDPALAAPALHEPLTPEDIAGAAMRGELGCSFTQPGARGPLLVAMADVADRAVAEGVLKLGPSALRLRGVEAGGFNRMLRGARLTSGQLEARITITGAAAGTGGESPPVRARLEIAGPAGSQQIAGEWTCGP